MQLVKIIALALVKMAILASILVCSGIFAFAVHYIVGSWAVGWLVGLALTLSLVWLEPQSAGVRQILLYSPNNYR